MRQPGKVSSCKFNRAQEEFGVYLNELQGGLSLQDCEVKNNASSGVMVVGDLEKEAHNNLPPSSLSFLSCHLQKNRDHGVCVTDYRGTLHFKRCLIENNF